MSFQTSYLHVLCMMAYITIPEPVLLIQNANSSKLSVPLTCVVMNGGISRVVENTLVLSTDQQASKVNSNINNNVKNICAFKFKMFKTPAEEETFSKSMIDNCVINNDLSIIIFCSTKTPLKDIWICFITTILQKKVIQIFCFDKIHHFVEFGLLFRTEFQKLKY